MTNKETVDRNIGLTFDFLRQVLKDPSILDEIPNKSILEFVEKDYTKQETKTSVKPNSFLRVKTIFELVSKKKVRLT